MKGSWNYENYEENYENYEKSGYKKRKAACHIYDKRLNDRSVVCFYFITLLTRASMRVVDD
jgi:hypothetical protein